MIHIYIYERWLKNH